MTDFDQKEQNPQPEPMPQPTPVPAPQPAPDPVMPSIDFPEPQASAWAPPTPQLTLDPDPVMPNIDFPEPPKAPEPPAQEQQPPVQYATYNYNFNTPPQPDYQQNQQPPQGYNAGYQPPNYTAQSYRPQPQQQPKYTTPPPGYQQKSRLAAGLLAFLLGSLGIHNFYLGNNTRGTIQLVLCLAGGLLTCGVGSVAAAIWGFIEGVSLLSANGPKFDGNGVILRD